MAGNVVDENYMTCTSCGHPRQRHRLNMKGVIGEDSARGACCDCDCGKYRRRRGTSR